MVLGHEKCGAVQASLGDEEPIGHLGALIDKIKPAVYMAKRMEGDLLTNAIQVNAEIVAEELKESRPILIEEVKKSELLIVPAYYQLSTGEVKLL